MQRRGFLECICRVCAGLGISSSYCGQNVLQALPIAGDHPGEGIESTDLGDLARWRLVDPHRSKEHRPRAELVSCDSPRCPGHPSSIHHSGDLSRIPRRGVVLADVPGRDPSLCGRPISASLQPVDYIAEVWLNGQHLGSHEGADTPFVFDATAFIRWGRRTIWLYAY